MAERFKNYSITVVCLLVLLASLQAYAAGERTASMIPEKKIISLKDQLPDSSKKLSSVRKRRAYKNVVSDSKSLIERYPDAPNRFEVLSIMLKSQRLLLAIEPSKRNREELIEICKQVSAGPAEYVEISLDADMMLMDVRMTREMVDFKERAEALSDLIKRYRDTSAELKSLQIAWKIAPKLEAFDLQRNIMDTLSERFDSDPVAIEWRRINDASSQLNALFTGTFIRTDGVSLSFPMNTRGHTSVMYFWSKETPDFQTHLAAMKDLQSRFPGKFNVDSLNLDQLPDAGEKKLRELRLDWTALHLPGGRKSQTYRTYAREDPFGLRVNALGYAFVGSTSTNEGRADRTPMEHNLDDLRYLAQLQSLLIGDFLVTGAGVGNETHQTTESVPAETLDAIQACFTTVPMRYRLTHKQALANYTKAEKLCRDAIAQYPKVSDLWRVRNCRIIALLGMWNLATDPKHLEVAADQARIALTATLPRDAAIVPRFCLAKESFLQGDRRSKSVLNDFIETLGATDAPLSVYAAASILAMDGNDRDLHAKYRQILLETRNSDPAIWPVVSFLRDQNHTFRMFKSNYYHPASGARRRVRSQLRYNKVADGLPADASGPLKTDFKTLTAGKWTLPQATDGKLTLLMFVEPPADPNANLPAITNGSIKYIGKKLKKTVTPGLIQEALHLVKEHPQKQIKVVVAFLSDDEDRVKGLVDKHNWPCQTLMVPGGLNNPIVRRLGILSADRVANIVLLGPDATIAWQNSGLVHPQHIHEGVGELRYAISTALERNINKYEKEASSKALNMKENK